MRRLLTPPEGFELTLIRDGRIGCLKHIASGEVFSMTTMDVGEPIPQRQVDGMAYLALRQIDKQAHR